MRKIDLIVIHCSATREDRPFTEHDLDTAHRLRGFDGIGYHFYVRRNGDIKSTRTVERVGAHARGTMLTQSVSAMRVDWTATDWQRTPGRSGSDIRCGYWCGR